MIDTREIDQHGGESSEARGERRRRRSDDPITALHYQLAFTRAEASFEAIVLVDESGCLVAGAGAWATCEELAAFAPLLAHETEVRSSAVGSRVAVLSSEVTVKSFVVGGAEVLLCGRGKGAAKTTAADKTGADEPLARASSGCARILSAA